MTGIRDLSQERARDGRPHVVEPLHGRAIVESVAETGVVHDGNPELELVLTVEVPGRPAYRATHRQVLSRLVLHALAPGATVSVTVDATEPARLEIR